TYTWIENVSSQTLAEFPRVRVVKSMGADSYLVIIPRYQEFSTTASTLARRDVRFREIAGNREIMLTALVPRSWNGDVLFSAPILTQPGTKRIAIRTAVASLHTILNDLSQRGARLEHIYDY